MKFMFFIFSKTVQRPDWSLSGCVWPPGLKFDIPALDNANIVKYKKLNFNKYLIVFVAGFQA